MRKQNKMNSILKVSFWSIFLFAFLMLPIGCNKTSTPESTNLEPENIVEPQVIAETQEVAEPQETAQVAEDTPEPDDKEIVVVTSEDDWNLVMGIKNTSSANNPTGMRAYIDGKLFMDQDVEYTVHRSGATFYFKLDEGEHMLKIETKNGNASLNQAFEITTKHYSHADYFNRPDSNDELSGEYFTFAIQDRLFISW